MQSDVLFAEKTDRKPAWLSHFKFRVKIPQARKLDSATGHATPSEAATKSIASFRIPFRIVSAIAQLFTKRRGTAGEQL